MWSAIQVQLAPLAKSCRAYSEKPYSCRSWENAAARSRFCVFGMARAACHAGRISPHAMQTRKGLTQQRIVERACCLKVCLQAPGLTFCHGQRQFEQEGGGRAPSHAAVLSFQAWGSLVSMPAR